MRHFALVIAATVGFGCGREPLAPPANPADRAADPEGPAAPANIRIERSGHFSRAGVPDWPADYVRILDRNIVIEDVTVEDRVVDEIRGGSTGSQVKGFLVNNGPDAVPQRQVRVVRYTRDGEGWKSQLCTPVTVRVLPIGRRVPFAVSVKWTVKDMPDFAVAAFAERIDDGRWVSLESNHFNRGPMPLNAAFGRILLKVVVTNSTPHTVSEYRVEVEFYDRDIKRLGSAAAIWEFDGVGRPMEPGRWSEFEIVTNNFSEPEVHFARTRAVGRIR